MSFLDTVLPKRTQLAPVPSLSSTASTNFWGFVGAEGIPDILRLRAWSESNPLIYAAMRQWCGTIANAEWEILPKDPHKPYSKRIQASLHEVFENPNPQGKNNSFNALIEPVSGDLVVAALGCILPWRDKAMRVGAMTGIDCARVRFKPKWEKDTDGARYVVMQDDGVNAWELRNDQLITIQANPITYSDIGISPVRVLHETLTAQKDTFHRVHQLHKHGSPAGFLNISGVTDEQLTKLRRQIFQALDSNASIGLFNYPAEFVNYQQLGTTDLNKQMVMEFFTYLASLVEMSFQMEPGTLLQSQLDGKPTRRVLSRGIVAYMRLIMSYFNREIVASYGDDNLQFVWTELAVNNEPQDAEVIRTRAGNQLNWVSINQLAKADGLPPYLYPKNDARNLWVNEPLVSIAPGQLAPISVAANLPQYRAEVMDAQAQAKVEGANNAAHQLPDAGDVGGQQQRQPEPQRTEQPAPESTDAIQEERLSRALDAVLA